MAPTASGPAPAAPAKVMCNLYGGLRTRHTVHQEALRAGEAAVGDEPRHRYGHVERVGDPWAHEGEPDPRGVQHQRRVPFDVTADGPRHRRVPVGGPEQVVVVVPVDPDHREAQHVHQQARQLFADGVQGRAVRGPQLQRHDRDDHRHDAVAERLHPGRPHLERPARTLLVLHRAEDGRPCWLIRGYPDTRTSLARGGSGGGPQMQGTGIYLLASAAERALRSARRSRPRSERGSRTTVALPSRWSAWASSATAIRVGVASSSTRAVAGVRALESTTTRSGWRAASM